MLKLDTRPSDAIAMAVRANKTIYINSVLLDAMGQDIC
jgi:bifunctional DNase/RNase